MKPVTAPIGIAKTARGLLITLPGRFWLLVSLRRAVKRLVAHEEPWTYLAPESKGVRIEQWVAEVEMQLAAESRRRAWSVSDAEWEAAPSAAAAPAFSPPSEPLIVNLPSAKTTRSTLSLLKKLEAGQVLVSTPDRGGAGALRIYVLRPSGRVISTRVARRAIEDRLVLPHCDGLFGPDTSQSWGFPTDLKPQES
ncbi:hypothetical protein MKK70_04975 [Methylobacterium sp. E-041]|uniref:hypothetical protein n=1 Tax=Methylobacterium sp. E-041 TaxID=2836573 RepID=UPI001FBB2156|nr:hypothetical protein [Methylobacterium sp. E-041]MCJ2104740.1 hypothetical protein [Methylobacterium sp. E-041]